MAGNLLRLVCWNSDTAVQEHWQKVISEKYQLSFVSTFHDARLALQAGDKGDFCFIFLDDEHFSTMVEHVVTIRNLFPELKIIAFPNQSSQKASLRMFSQGVNGQCAPYIAADQLALAMSVVEAGEIWGGKRFIENLISESAKFAQEPGEVVNRGQRRGDDKRLANDVILASLSEREMAVAGQVAQGFNNKRIAQHLEITDRTVKAHLTAIFKKLDLKDRLSLALLVQNSSYLV